MTSHQRVALDIWMCTKVKQKNDFQLRSHIRTGVKYQEYATYDLVRLIVDLIEVMTTLCGFAYMNFVYSMLLKRKL
ncbi:hypothetical protein BBI17_005030 [Phytophthora kernoviae]|uniref:Uncharacterized protein n=1 Tax=Phytophthora kernoviae TaxID=325452 RepID=A0A3R7IFI4_9STRA|nr:hypothetical protein JM16_000802 [Phytophthora kernoviae]RLN05926.1 hypothetical protein BBI17_005030 [Phytophthora kernoviae]